MAKFSDLVRVRVIEAERFWVIGDIHGSNDQLLQLMSLIKDHDMQKPVSSVIICVGDICDRGPDSLMALHNAYYMANTSVDDWSGAHYKEFLTVMGNHDHKLLRALGGAQVQLTNGLDKTMFQVMGVGQGWTQRYADFLRKAPLMVVLRVPECEQQAVVVHAGYYEGMLDDPVEKVAPYALFGPRDGVTPEGFPNRIEWENTYEGRDFVFYGHRIVGAAPKFRNGTCGVDTGCYESGVLTAVSYPELHVLQTERTA